MRIISQDGEFDLPYEETAIQAFTNGEVVAFSLSDIGNDYFIPIAKYSTKEKAIRAMEMCARKYEACEVTAFKFPKDSEVEV